MSTPGKPTKKRQSTLAGFITPKKPRTTGPSVAGRRSYITYESKKSVPSKAIRHEPAREIIKVTSDSEEDDIQITGKQSLDDQRSHYFKGSTNSTASRSNSFNTINRFNSTNGSSNSYALKTTMGSVTTEKAASSSKSISTFQKIESLAFKHKPRLARSSSVTSAASSKTSTTSHTTINFSEEQLRVLDMIVNKSESVFFTGSAGTGKSVLLREIIQRLLAKHHHRDDLVAVTASTGLAAVNIGGQTIHRFAGIGIGTGSVEALAARITKNEQAHRRWRVARVLVIDEISMIDGDLFTKLGRIAQTVRKSSLPFGGLQVVLTGDFFQLPPVPERNSQRIPKYAFQSPVWQEVVSHTVLLTQVFRQRGDTELIDMLNTVRLGNCTPAVAARFQRLAREVRYPDGLLPTELYPTRNEVSSSNSARLRSLPGVERKFFAQDIFSSEHPGVVELEKRMLDNVLAPSELVLKDDAQVLMLKNVDDVLVNGSVGRVLTFLTEPLFTAVKNIYGEDNLETPHVLKQLRFISQCIGGSGFSDDAQIRHELSSFSSEEKRMMQRFVQGAFQASQKFVFPVVAFSIPGRDHKKIELVKPQEFKTLSATASASKKSCARVQVPLLLSWALSIHKSQGQTLDRVKVDLARIFEKGQVYVALSRATSQERLQILNFTPSKIRASAEVIEFYANLEQVKSS